MRETPQTSKLQLLKDAVREPGLLSDAYSRFWNYSIGNQLMALTQCQARQIEPGPINSFSGWRSLKRYPIKGQTALWLWFPIHRMRTLDDGTEVPFTTFVLKNRWFVLSQTYGREYVPKPLPKWTHERALQSLKCSIGKFDILNGNVQGYADPEHRTVHLNPVCEDMTRVLLHELAHIILNHHQGDLSRVVKEVEAELTAMFVIKSVAPWVTRSTYSVGYIKHWLSHSQRDDEIINNHLAGRVFNAVDKILKAGRPSPRK